MCLVWTSAYSISPPGQHCVRPLEFMLSLQVHLEYNSKGDQYGTVHPPVSVSRNPYLRIVAP
jgi:hypothetical protein